VTAVLDAATAMQAGPTAWVARACRDTEDRIADAIALRDVSLAAHVRAAAQEALDRAKRDQMPQPVLTDLRVAVRRAERAIGLTIRAGQAAGEIRRQYADAKADLPGPQDLAGASHPCEFTDYYAMTDGIPDEAFEAAINAARAEGRVSRANVLRKIADGAPTVDTADERMPDPQDRSSEAAVQRRVLIRDLAATRHTSDQIADRLGITPESVRRIARGMRGVTLVADQVMAGTRRRYDPVAAARDTIIALAGLADGVGGLTLDGLDRAEAQEWAVSLAGSLRVLTRFDKEIKELSK